MCLKNEDQEEDMKKRYLLKDAALLKEDASCLMNQNLYVEDGKISCIIASEQDDRTKEVDEIIDCSRYYVSCGLPNMHVHTAMNIFKGIAEDVTTDQWFNEMIFPYESKMTDEDVYLGTKLGIAEMINNGVTVFADHYFGDEQVLQAIKDTGIRGDMAPTIFGSAPNYKERLDQATEFIQKHRNDSTRIGFHMGPHSNYTCPPETLAEMADRAKALDLPIHLHLAEEELQVKLAQEQFGLTPFGMLHEAGMFDCKLLIAHGLWITEDDLKYVKEDTCFAFCPKTYMKLGSGIGGFFRLYQQLNYAFGSDGAASSNTLNPVEQARLFALLGKYLDDDGSSHKAEDMWRHLMSGHDAFSFGSGKLREGAPADLVIWDLHQLDTFPIYHPITSILYSSNSSNVRYTMVEGEFLKYDGRLVMDQEELLREAGEAQRALLSRGKGKANVAYLK